MPKSPKNRPRLLGETTKDLPLKPKGTILGKTTFIGLQAIDVARIEAGFALAHIDPLESNLLGYSTRCFVQANLPHSDPKHSPDIWVRRNGDFSLTIQSDVSINPSTGKKDLVGIPYGVIPRLILMYICSEAKRTKSREISLGANLSGFLRELGMEPRGGKRGDITRFKNQMQRLVTAKIKFEYFDGKTKVGYNASIAKKWFFFWDHKNPNQDTLFENRIVLDEDFFNEIVKSPVPLHLGVVGQLKNSPFGLDLYTWLTYRVSRLEKAVFIKWEDLEAQLGADYGETKNFARRAKQVLREIQTLWKGLNFEMKKGGFLLKPSSPSIPLSKQKEESLR